MNATLSGSHIQTMDDRLRVPIPSKMVPILRAMAGVGANDDIPVVFTFSPRRTVAVYPQPAYDRMIDQLKSKQKSRPTPNIRKLIQAYVNYKEEQSLDKQNRVRVPQIHATIMGLSGEVAIVGSEDHLEIMSMARFKEVADEVLPIMGMWVDSADIGDEEDGSSEGATKN
jgi:DNA-binding transcriptional regulator/RsmH inhibitor MraZ